MTTIYLIRHCEAENNRYRRCCGQFDCGVTPRGRRQALALAERFSDIPLDAVYASDLYRTRYTVQAVADSHSLPLRPFSGLREMHMGYWENRAWSDVRRSDPEGVDIFWNRFHEIDMRPLGGESIAGIAERIYQNLTLLCRLHPGETIAVASHGLILRTFFHKVLGLEPQELNRFPLCPNTGVSLVSWDEGRFNIEYMNDASHLDPGQKGLRPDELRPRPRTEPEELLFYRPASAEDREQIAAGCVELGLTLGKRDHITAATTEAGELAGYIVIDPTREDDVAILRAVVLVPRFRGRKLSMQLMGEACAAAGRLGKQRLRILPLGRHEESRAFFEENSFVAQPDGKEGLVLERPVFAPSIL